MAVCWDNISSYKQDSNWSWFICFCTTVCVILSVGFTNALGVLFPVFMDYFKESRERAAWVTSVVTGVNLFLGPVMSAFLNRFGFRIAIILGCLTCSTGLALGSFASSIVVLYFSFSLPFALGQSLIFVTSAIIANNYFDKRKSIALGIVTAAQGLGTMILGPTLQALVNVFDWRNTFRVFAGLMTLVSLTGCILHQGTSSAHENQRNPSKKFRLNLKSLLKDQTIVVLVITAGLYTFSRVVPYVHLIKHCDDLGIPAGKSSTVYLFIGIFASSGRISGGVLSGMKYINTRLLLQAATLIMGASTMLLTLAKTYAGLVVYAIIFSTADGLMVTSCTIKCLEVVEERKKASVFGLQMMFSGIFALSSPPLSGLIADRLGSYIASFLMAGGVGIIASLLPFLLLCVKPPQSGEVGENIDLDDDTDDEAEAQIGITDV